MFGLKTLAAGIAFILVACVPRAWSTEARSAASARLSNVDSIVQQAIHDGQIPGAVVVIGHNDQIIYRKAFGNRALEPRREPMTLDTVFDLASLTKVIATTTSIMQLAERGKIRVADPVTKYLPEFGQNGKEDITVRQLLTHYSGLAPDLDLKAPWTGKDTAYRMALAEKPETPVGAQFVYSDIGFIVLGALVENASGESLDAYTSAHIFAPLGMTHTRYLPPKAWRPKIAPTQYDDHNHMLRGEVHDPTAFRMGGVAGHAGLFSTGDDLSKFARALLNGGGGILSPTMVEKMTTPEQPPNAPRYEVSDGISIRRSRRIGVTCCRSDRTGTRDSRVRRCGSTPLRAPTSSCLRTQFIRAVKGTQLRCDQRSRLR